MTGNSEDLQIKLARKYLKMKLMEDNISFRGHEQQRLHVYDILSRTVTFGESNSALIIGPRGSGKTTLVNSVLHELQDIPAFKEDSIIVKLNGLIHTDDKIALNSITSQMSLDNAIGDRVFGSFAENLAFLLSCLKSGKDKHCKSVLFFLDEFDLFCHVHGSQTLLYNLFDVAQSRQAPICVIGITCRLDVVELLEKRVKSRFSHRQIFLFPNCQKDDDHNPFDDRMQLFCDLLCLPVEISKHNDTISRSSEKLNTDSINLTPRKDKRNNKKIIQKKSMELEQNTGNLNEFEISHDILKECNSSWKDFRELDPIFVSFWNESIRMISKDDKVKGVLERLYNLDVSERFFRDILFRLVCMLSADHPQIESKDIIDISENCLGVDDKTNMLLSLSVLELSLIITMKHHAEIFDNQPVNFEIVFNRYSKYVNSNSSSQTVPRAVVLKAFEHLPSLELISPSRMESHSGTNQLQKEYVMHRLNVTPTQIMNAVKLYKSIPTELAQWAASSLL